MTDLFALFGEARRPFLDPEALKEKYHALSRESAPTAELNEAFRVLNDPKLRLQHLLALIDATPPAGRAVPPMVAELFWQTGNLLREIESWQRRNAAATGHLARAMLQPARAKLEKQLSVLEEQLREKYADSLADLRALDANWSRRGRDDAVAPNELATLLELHDFFAYLTRLLERAGEARLQLTMA